MIYDLSSKTAVLYTGLHKPGITTFEIRMRTYFKELSDHSQLQLCQDLRFHCTNNDDRRDSTVRRNQLPIWCKQVYRFHLTYMYSQRRYFFINSTDKDTSRAALHFGDMPPPARGCRLSEGGVTGVIQNAEPLGCCNYRLIRRPIVKL